MLFEDEVAKQEPKPEPKRTPGTHRLQPFTAEVEAPAAPAAPSSPSGSTSIQSLAQAYSNPASMVPAGGSAADALGRGYALMYGMTPEETDAAAEPVTAKAEPETKTYAARETKKLSWDDYLDLDRRERAAVDFNTLLVQARQKDLKHQDDYEQSPMQDQIYDKAVTRMFGDDGGSATFAPETVALLNDIGFKQTDAKRFDDLDDFLGLSSALTAKDFEHIGQLHPDTAHIGVETPENTMDLSLGGLVAPPPVPNDTNAQAATTVAAGTDTIRASLTRGNQVLENFRRVAAGDRNESIGFYGGTPNKLASPDIRLGQKDDQYFEMAFGALANAGNDPSVLEAIKADLGTGDRYRRFLAYADTKSRYSMDHGVTLGPDQQITYRTPEQFRQLLGLEKGGETSADRG